MRTGVSWGHFAKDSMSLGSSAEAEGVVYVQHTISHIASPK